MRLTTTTIRALELPAGTTDKTYFDDDLPGFGVRLRAGGSKVWVVTYKNAAGLNRRIVLGAVTALDVGKARSTAKDLLAKARLGQDPAGDRIAEREQAADTFGKLLPGYLKLRRAELRPASMTEIERALLKYAATWHNIPVAKIDRRMVALKLTEVAEKHGATTTNRFRAAASGYFTWLAKEGIVDANPVTFTNVQPEPEARVRMPSDAEIAAIWRHAGEGQYADILRLLILTGGRREEIGGLRWSEIDLDAGVIMLPKARTKNGHEKRLPISPAVADILRKQDRRGDRDLVFGYGEQAFSGWSKAKRDLDARLAAAGTPVPEWRVHDLRRSVSTTMHGRLGVAPHIVEAILGHVGHKSGVSGVYNKADYSEPMRIALDKWADHVAGLVGDHQSAVVVKFPKRA
jgi:integrase